MRRAVAAIAVAIAAVVAANVLLLGYGRERHDPVGRLSPVANLPQGSATVPAVPTLPTSTVTGEDD